MTAIQPSGLIAGQREPAQIPNQLRDSQWSRQKSLEPVWTDFAGVTRKNREFSFPAFENFRFPPNFETGFSVIPDARGTFGGRLKDPT